MENTSLFKKSLTLQEYNWELSKFAFTILPEDNSILLQFLTWFHYIDSKGQFKPATPNLSDVHLELGQNHRRLAKD